MGDPIMNDLPSPHAPLINGWRIAGWGSLLALLTLPALAMQMTNEVNWTAGDFIFAAILLGLVGTVVELALRFARPGAPRIGYLIAGFTAFLPSGRTPRSASSATRTPSTSSSSS